MLNGILFAKDASVADLKKELKAFISKKEVEIKKEESITQIEKTEDKIEEEGFEEEIKIKKEERKKIKKDKKYDENLESLKNKLNNVLEIDSDNEDEIVKEINFEEFHNLKDNDEKYTTIIKAFQSGITTLIDFKSLLDNGWLNSNVIYIFINDILEVKEFLTSYDFYFINNTYETNLRESTKSKPTTEFLKRN
jgi:hypothetical protein